MVMAILYQHGQPPRAHACPFVRDNLFAFTRTRRFAGDQRIVFSDVAVKISRTNRFQKRVLVVSERVRAPRMLSRVSEACRLLSSSVRFTQNCIAAPPVRARRACTCCSLSRVAVGPALRRRASRCGAACPYARWQASASRASAPS